MEEKKSIKKFFDELIKSEQSKAKAWRTMVKDYEKGIKECDEKIEMANYLKSCVDNFLR